MPDPAPATPTEPKADTTFNTLLDTLGLVVNDNIITKTPPPPPPPPAPVRPYEGKVGEQITMNRAAAAEAAAPTAPPAETPAASSAPPAAGTPPAPPVAPAPTPAVHKSTAAQISAELAKLNEQLQQKVTPAAPAPPAPPTNNADDDYIASLSDDDREELELAKLAEIVLPANYKAQSAKTLEFFKKRDKFKVENPEADDDSEDFTSFVAENRPKLAETHRRKLEIEKSNANLSIEMERKQQEKIAVLEKKLRDLEVKPLVESAVSKFRETISTGTFKAPDGLEKISPDVAKLIAEKGYEAAREEFPDEAPFLVAAENTAKAYLELTNGLAAFNAQNPYHAHVYQFLVEKGNAKLNEPETARTRTAKINGRDVRQEFVPLQVFNNLTPEQKATRYTFGPEDVLNLIALDAHEQAAVKRKQAVKVAARLGYVKADPAKSANGASPTAATVPPVTPSPRAQGSTAPGPANNEPSLTDNQRLVATLIPGWKPA